jgi:hypothetical protein
VTCWYIKGAQSRSVQLPAVKVEVEIGSEMASKSIAAASIEVPTWRQMGTGIARGSIDSTADVEVEPLKTLIALPYGKLRKENNWNAKIAQK